MAEKNWVRIEDWNTLVDNLGGRAQEVYNNVKSRMEQRTIPGVQMQDVRVAQGAWVMGTQETREQLHISFRRAHVYFGAYPYGTDLYVTWSGYVDVTPGCMQGCLAVILPFLAKEVTLTNYMYDDIYALEQAVHHSAIEVLSNILSSEGMDTGIIDKTISHRQF